MNTYISSSIVTYKDDPAVLCKTIESFLNTELPVKLFVLDNSPTNYLESFCNVDNVEYIFGHGNVGFGAAHNIIMSQAEKLGKYHLVLNPDIYFAGGVLETLGYYLDSHTDVGLITPNVYYPNGDLQYLCKLLPTPLDWVGRLLIPFKSVKNVINNRFELRFSGYNSIMNIPYISGCFMLLRSSVIEEVGGFDERIFMYGEDTDLTRRIHEKYKTLFYPHVHIFHEFHKGSHRNFRLFKIHIKSAIYYFNKWGWFFDKSRRQINRMLLNELGYGKS